jgi:hypothetical protein
LIEPLGERPGDLEAAGHLGDVSGAEGEPGAALGGPEQQTGSPRRSARSRASAVRALSLVEQVRRERGNAMSFEDPHDGGVVASGAGEGDGFVGERLAMLEAADVGELGAELGEHERAGRVGGRKSSEGELQHLDALGVDGVVENIPRLFARAAVTRRSVSPRAAARRAAWSRCSGTRDRRSGVARCRARSPRRCEDASASSVLLAEGQRLAVVLQGVGRGQRRERGVAGPTRVVDGLGDAVAWETLDQWRASSPTRDPGRSPQSSSSASATRRCARACRVRPRASYTCAGSERG